MNLSPKSATAVSSRQAIEILRPCSKIAIITHYRPDGDAIGSMLALAASLQEWGKEVVCINRDPVPAYLDFLQTEQTFVCAPDTADLNGVELVVALDCATIERLGDSAVSLLPDVPVITIDHHITNEEYGDHLILDATSAATGEILYQIISENHLPLPTLSRDALYVAISTDTGSLQYSNATARTYSIMAQLVDAGVDVAHINSQTYFNHSVRKVELLRECLQSFSLSHDGQVSHWTISQAAQSEIGAQPGDMEGLMDILRGISGVRVCFTLEESSSGAVRLSMRSKDDLVDVSKICGHFGGGGHRMAAGAAINLPLEDCLQQVLAVTEKAL